MAWTGDIARIHCDVISAETYLANALGVIERIHPDERPLAAQVAISIALTAVRQALPELERGVSPDVLQLLHGQVIPVEDPWQ